MPTNILMPALSPTMTEGNLAKWHKKEGDTVKAGEVIAEIETDKATMEVEAVDEGILGKILVAAGTQNVSVNTPIATLLADGETNDNSAAGPVPVKNDLDIPCQPQSKPPEGGPVKTQVTNQPLGNHVEGNRDIRYAKGEIFEPPVFDEAKFMANTKTQTVREALRDAMAEEMRADDKIYVMGEEVAEYNGAYKVTQGLLDEFGAKRVIDTPISEHGFAGIAVGSAFKGLKPIVEFMTMNFAMQAIDHIINSAAKTLYMAGGQLGCPIVFRGPNGAASRVGAQHSQNYASWYAHVPGLKVIAPWSAADCKGMMKAAIRDPNPVVMLENEIMYGQSFEVPMNEDYVIPIGRAKIEREGKDVTIVAYSIMVGKSLKAAEQLAAEGIDAEVINLRTIRPLDRWTILESVKKTNRIVCVEEDWPFAGVNAEISALVMEHAFDYLDAPVARVNAVDVPLPYAANLEALALPQPEHIVAAVKKVCYRG